MYFDAQLGECVRRGNLGSTEIPHHANIKMSV